MCGKFVWQTNFALLHTLRLVHSVQLFYVLYGCEQVAIFDRGMTDYLSKCEYGPELVW